jgi:ribosomal protein S18 acetylase RimI-like enzyme
MPEIDIRPVLPGDVENLSVFEHGYHSTFVWQMDMDLNHDTMKTDFHRRRLPRQVFVAYPRGRDEIFGDLSQAEAFLTAVLDNRPVGYIKVLAERSTKIARVSDLVVSASFRRQGIASGLLLATMDLISHRNFLALILEMQSKNDPAIAMATKLGFKFFGFRDNYFPNDDLAIFFGRFAH